MSVRHHVSATTLIRSVQRMHLLMWGIILCCLGAAIYMLGVLIALPCALIGSLALLRISELLVWYSGVPLVAGLVLALIDLFLLLGDKRSSATEVRFDRLIGEKVVVVLTAYNDELSIAAAVEDFRAHPLVSEVIVVSNNSSDRTLLNAREVGAIAVDEPVQGYGRCVYRCLQEGIARGTEMIVLSEGDRTFRAYDIDKLMAYAPHADIVNGTRTVERLRARDTQLSTFMYYGNLFVGKILEAKHVGRSTITDVGTTFKLCRRDALLKLMPHLNPAVNLEFNAHFLDVAIGQGLDLVECPITFHPRIGLSKGGNVNNGRALRVGMRMLLGIVYRWSFVAS
jgi:hypothetical protein